MSKQSDETIQNNTAFRIGNDKYRTGTVFKIGNKILYTIFKNGVKLERLWDEKTVKSYMK